MLLHSKVPGRDLFRNKQSQYIRKFIQHYNSNQGKVASKVVAWTLVFLTGFEVKGWLEPLEV